MYSRSDPSLLGNVPMDQPPPPVSIFNPAAPQLMQHVQLVQAFPVVHPVYPQAVPVVLNQTRMPVTLLPQAGAPLTVSRPPPTTTGRHYTTRANCSIFIVIISQ